MEADSEDDRENTHNAGSQMVQEVYVSLWKVDVGE
jgi:hypothetical protein